MISLSYRRGSRLLGFGVAGALLAVAAVHAAPATAQAAAAPRPLSPAEAAIKTLDRAQIDALLARPDKVLILDVRRADEIGTIGGFPVFLNAQTGDLEREVAFIPRDREIITVSNHAHRAVRAAALLAGKGFKVAGAAGAQDYEAQGGTLTGKKPAAAATPAAGQPGSSGE